MYVSATGAQVKNQFFASLSRFQLRPAFNGWTWLETEVRNSHGGFLFGHIRALIANPPAFVPGPKAAFCDFAGPGDESVLAVCEGNRASVVDAWRSRDTMHSVGKFLTHFRRLGLFRLAGRR